MAEILENQLSTKIAETIGPNMGAKAETRDLEKLGNTPNHRQHRGIFGMVEILESQLSTKIAKQKWPNMGPKAKLVILENSERYQNACKIVVFSGWRKL